MWRVVVGIAVHNTTPTGAPSPPPPPPPPPPAPAPGPPYGCTTTSMPTVGTYSSPANALPRKRRMKEVLPYVVWGCGPVRSKQGCMAEAGPLDSNTYTPGSCQRQRTTAFPPSTMIFFTISGRALPHVAAPGGSIDGVANSSRAEQRGESAWRRFRSPLAARINRSSQAAPHYP